jgi:hypothetical protein
MTVVGVTALVEGAVMERPRSLVPGVCVEVLGTLRDAEDFLESFGGVIVDVNWRREK